MAMIQEIAAKAGVSVNTARRVLRGDNKEVWPSAIQRGERIRAIARELGYRPNSAARAVRRGRFDTVALVARQYQTFLPASLLRGASNALSRESMRLTFTELPTDRLVSEGYVPQVLRELCVDGLLIDYVSPDHPRTIDLLAQHQVPAVWLNDDHPFDCARPDDARGVREALAELIALGHRRIGYAEVVPRGHNHYSLKERRESYRDTMRGHGLAEDVLTVDLDYGNMYGGDSDTRIRRCREWLGRPARPTAVVAYEVTMALPIALAASSLGQRVPQDVSLVTFHAEPVFSTGVEMKVWRVPMEEVGRAGVGLLLKKIADPDQRLAVERIPYRNHAGRVLPPGTP
jgi:DNA-binding LacI/PurR family transcriptional regulator